MSVLPYPHGTAAGTIGEGAHIDQSTIGATVAGMFVAPGEAGSSAGNNRAHWGLSVNVDHIMGRIQRELPQPTTSAYTAGVGGDANVQVTAAAVDVFIGLVGYAGDDINSVVRVLDREGNQLTVDGQPVMITNIQKPLGGDIFPPLATVDQFQTDPFVVFSTPIPEGADYQLVYAVNTQVEELGQDCLMADRTQFYATRNVRTVQVVDRTTANAIVGPTPVLPFNPTEFGWPDFYCHVRGKIFAVAAGTLAVANNQYVVAYVDEFGAVNIAEFGAAYQAISPEDNLVLAYGQTDAVGAWSDDTDMAMALTSYPVYVTVGRSHTAETNFDDLQKAIDFIGYLWQYISDEAKMADDVFGLPRIMIVSAVSVSSTINLGSPIWIEGAFADRRQASIAFRRPQLEFDVVADLFDCVDGATNYPMVVKDLWLVYTPVGNRTGYMFFKPGKRSVFDHVYVEAVKVGAYTGGFVDVGGRGTKLVDCRVVHGSDDVGGLPVVNAVYVDADKNADNLLIDRCEFSSLNGNANERLIVGDRIDGLVVRDTELSLCAGVDIRVTGVGGANGKITLERVVATSTAINVKIDAAVATADTDVTMDDCKFAGEVYAGTTTPLSRIVLTASELAAEYGLSAASTTLDRSKRITACGRISVVGDGQVFVGKNYIEYDGVGSFIPALTVDINAGAGDVYTIDVYKNKLEIDTALATIEGIHVSHTAGAYPRRLAIEGNNVDITTSALAAGIFGVRVDSSLCQVLRIQKNEVVIDATIAGFDTVFSAGIYAMMDPTAMARVYVDKNRVYFKGVSAAGAGAVCTFANIDSNPCGIAVYYTGVGGWQRLSLVDNEISCDIASGYTIFTGIFTTLPNDMFIRGNRIKNCYRGIIAYQPGGSPIVYGRAAVTDNIVTDLGMLVSADGLAWEDSACGICVGVNTPAGEHHDFESAIVCNNVVTSSVKAIIGATQRHLYNVKVDNAAGGPISFLGNHALDLHNTGYASGVVMATINGWNLDIGGGGLAKLAPDDIALAAAGVANAVQIFNVGTSNGAMILSPP